METELKELKSVLRSLVVSSPTEVDLRTLLRDYRNMMGETIPIAKFGYRDGLAFIKEQCSDCFLVQNSSLNPVLTLIVPDTVKHIDKFVQKQKNSSTTRFKGKRRSIPESAFTNRNLIVSTFKAKANNIPKTEYAVVEEDKEILNKSYYSNKSTMEDNRSEECIEVPNGVCSTNAFQDFMKKRMPMLNGSQFLDSEICIDSLKDKDKDSLKADTDSGRQTSSSNSSGKKALLEELKMEIREVIADVPEGVWCRELMRLYREKYGRELNFTRFGFTSVLSLAYAVEDLQYCVAEHTGELLLRVGGAETEEAGAQLRSRTRPRLAGVTLVPRQDRDLLTGDPEDALPGIDFDEDVFPRDCMHIIQSIPTQSLEDLAPGSMLEVVLGEVYSPTHFWMLRLGPAHYLAMEDLMDEMNVYYRGEGRERVLAGGAVRVGHYCACCYLGDWHRAVVVKIIDSDTVKVRHIDYATVETVEARSLKPLLRRWANLPAQAVRARLAGARPPAGGRRWPWAAAAHFLTLVKEHRLIANVVAKDAQEGILEVLLIDTSTEDDICISTEMCRSGHADPRPDSALGTSECYLYPSFTALETGDTPNYAEIYCYLRDGISLEFVDDYRRHVPPCLPPAARLASPEPHAHHVPLAVELDRESSPPSEELSSTSREPAKTTPQPISARPVVTAMRSLGITDHRPLKPHAERTTSLDTNTCLQSGIVGNQIPLRCPEPGAGPAHSPRPERPPPQRARQFQHYQSLPPGGFPAPIVDVLYPTSHPSMHLSPFAPSFYPQSFRPHPPPLLNFSNPFSMFTSDFNFYPTPNPPIIPERPLGPIAAPVPPVPQGGVSVPASECEIFAVLSKVDPIAAQRYMVDALSRAVANTCVTLSTSAPVPLPRVSAETQTELPLRPPPGFERAAQWHASPQPTNPTHTAQCASDT